MKGSNQAILVLLRACIYALHMRGHIRVLDYLPMLLILIMSLHYSLLLLLIFIALHAAQHPFISTVRVHCVPRRRYVLSVEDIRMGLLFMEMGASCWDI